MCYCILYVGQLEDLKLCIARVTDELQIERERGSLVAKDYNSLMKDFEQLQVELQDQVILASL